MGSAIFDIAIPFIVVLGVLVFFHELGHHLAAKIFGMKVDAFSLGFPPRAWGFRWASSKLRPKFRRDILKALSASPLFRQIHETLVARGVSTTEASSAAALSDAVQLKVESTTVKFLNKRGKEQERTEEQVLIAKNPACKLESSLIEKFYSTVSSHPEFADLLLKYQEIEDDGIFDQKYKTDYCVSWLPLGGYCKINGMIDESFDSESMKEGPALPWEYRAKPIWQRMVAILGGILFNFALAIVIYLAIALRQGVPDIDKYNEYKLGSQISSVSSGSPAEGVGLQAGDRIIKIDGTPVDDWRQIVEIIQAKPEVPVTIEWLRGEEKMTAQITPQRHRTQTRDGIREIGQIGIGAPVHPEFVREASFVEAVGYGVANTYFITRLILTNVKQIITGEVSFRESMGGPVAIVKMTGEVKKQQGWEGILGFMALLSISLAVFNLFPIPALDGGHFLMLLVEGAIRRPLSIKFKLYAQQIGMALLLTFIAYVTFNDLTR